MATNEKILKALKSAITHLDNSTEAIEKKDENPLEHGVWNVAAELEYALFLFSITVHDEINKSKWKLSPKLKKSEVSLKLVKVQDLLNEAEKYVKNEKLLDAYKNASIARNYILKIQKVFAKKKREALKEKKRKKN